MRGYGFGLLALLAMTAPALAQSLPVVGAWSSTAYLPDGSAYASFYMEFSPDGHMHERILTTAGGADYYGEYNIGPGGQSVQFIMHDYEPKSIPPALPLNAQFNMPVQFSNQNTMVVMDGSGPMEFHRQR